MFRIVTVSLEVDWTGNSLLKALKMKPLNKKTVLFALVGFCLFGAAGCAHNKMGNDLNERLSEGNDVKTSEELRAEVRKSIDSSSHLSADQRSKLMEVKMSATEKMDKLREQSFSLKSVLLKEILTDTYTVKEEKRIKARIEQIEHERLETFFDAILRANEVLGKTNPDRPRLMHELWLNRP